MERWVWFTWWFLLIVRYSRLFRVYHKKHETLHTNAHILIYIVRINRLVSKIKDWYNLEFQMPETMNLFDKTEILRDKATNGEHVQNFEVVKAFLVQCNLVDNQYQ